jgi:hypothetical protein
MEIDLSDAPKAMECQEPTGAGRGNGGPFPELPEGAWTSQ